MVVCTALMIWKGLGILFNTESPIVVVLRFPSSSSFCFIFLNQSKRSSPLSAPPSLAFQSQFLYFFLDEKPFSDVFSPPFGICLFSVEAWSLPSTVGTFSFSRSRMPPFVWVISASSSSRIARSQLCTVFFGPTNSSKPTFLEEPPDFLINIHYGWILFLSLL